MAKKVTRQDIEAWPVVSYQEIRSTLQSGDLFLTSGDVFLSNLIQKFSKSPWSHSGIVFRLESLDRMLLLEAVEDGGVRLAPLSKYLSDYEHSQPYPGLCVLARRKGLSPEQVNSLAKFGLDALTRPYDNAEIARIVGRIALGEGRHEDDTAYICSELVQACYQAAGWPFKEDARGFIAPKDIWNDPAVSLLARIL
ncbi:MAG: hypothetical protein HY910_07715 [Desulfarculus sp.]|nr:hypothetical protein [Desulfarculus sp.]